MGGRGPEERSRKYLRIYKKVQIVMSTDKNVIFLQETLVLLQETTQNVSMKVISLQRECVKTTILKSVMELNNQVCIHSI